MVCSIMCCPVCSILPLSVRLCKSWVAKLPFIWTPFTCVSLRNGHRLPLQLLSNFTDVPQTWKRWEMHPQYESVLCDSVGEQSAGDLLKLFRIDYVPSHHFVTSIAALPYACQPSSTQRKPTSLSAKNGSFIPRATTRARSSGLYHEPPLITRSASPFSSLRPSLPS